MHVKKIIKDDKSSCNTMVVPLMAALCGLIVGVGGH